MPSNRSCGLPNTGDVIILYELLHPLWSRLVEILQVWGYNPSLPIFQSLHARHGVAAAGQVAYGIFFKSRVLSGCRPGVLSVSVDEPGLQYSRSDRQTGCLLPLS